MISPMVLTSCGHSFDESAIRKWLAKNKKCPLCNKEASEENMLKNFSLAAICNTYS
jgi:predicted Zn-ribbon and HTH transcriptional regulator